MDFLIEVALAFIVFLAIAGPIAWLAGRGRKREPRRRRAEDGTALSMIGFWVASRGSDGPRDDGGGGGDAGGV